MIIFKSTKDEFIKLLDDNELFDIIADNYKSMTKRNVSPSEYNSWVSSLRFVAGSLRRDEIPGNTGIAIEYQIPISSNRIDLTISGLDQNKNEVMLLIELKQWSEVELVDFSNTLVNTFVGKAMREVVHPSYQVASYKQMLNDYVEYIQHENVKLDSVAFLHNMQRADSPLLDDRFMSLVESSPLFFKSDTKQLGDYVSGLFYYGDNGELINKIDSSKLVPSRELKKEVSNIINGIDKFNLIDNQKVVVEKIVEYAKLSKLDNEKRVVIIKGGPGTGKTLVALKAIAELFQTKSKYDFMVAYVSKNSAVRDVYKSEIGSSIKSNINQNKIRFDALFKGSSSFTNLVENKFDVLLVDEAHRLVPTTQYKFSKYKNQIMDIIIESKVAIFFMDEKQQVEYKGIGTTSNIIDAAIKLGVKPEFIYNDDELHSQFRAMGSNNYMDFVDDFLYNQEFVKMVEFLKSYEFKVFDSASAMQEELKLKQNSRIVAGYCWDWKTKKMSKEVQDQYDIEIDDFKIRWNFDNGKQDWLIQKDSFDYAGCIHTTQGLEMDYCGVIIGDDLFFDGTNVQTDYTKRAKTDKSLNGCKTELKNCNNDAEKETILNRLDKLIRNTYRVLLTRGIKGTYVYATDPKLRNYLRRLLEQ
jgi:DUF2075 family protein